jgi:hypothetical protein
MQLQRVGRCITVKPPVTKFQSASGQQLSPKQVIVSVNPQTRYWPAGRMERTPVQFRNASLPRFRETQAFSGTDALGVQAPRSRALRPVSNSRELGRAPIEFQKLVESGTVRLRNLF